MDIQNEKAFERELIKRVNTYLKSQPHNRFATPAFFTKSVVMALFMWGTFALLIFSHPPIWLYMVYWVLLGLATAGIGMNVMHDANHDAVSGNKKVNKIFGASLYFLCGNVLNWKIQHNHLHHNFTNEYGIDEDVNTHGLIRLHPEENWKKMHRFQHWYGPFLYGLLTLNWAFQKEFRQLFEYKKRGLTDRFGGSFTRELLILGISKAIYFFLFIGLPVWVGGISIWWVIPGFALMHFVAGVVLSFIFQLAHVVPEVETERLTKVRAVHQLNTTANFSTESKVITWLVGGLNFQVEHHLFPGVCHVHYPKINKIVKETTREYGVSYFEHGKFSKALVGHIRYLKALGNIPTFQRAAQ